MPLKKGDVIELDGLRVTVLDTQDGNPTEAEFVIPGAEDKKRACWLTFNDGLLKPYTLPEIGKSDTIVWTPPG
jgi:L-ascorbate metabolism protein UlaG (beta-lactamase superfamily)